MDAVDIARVYAARIAEQEMVAYKQALEAPETQMKHWIARLLDCKSLDDFREMLARFSQANRWTIVQKAEMSTHYTPKVMKLVAGLDDGEKWKWLDELSDLCWRTP